uniref:Peptidase M15A n=1 Tax=uncultured bacterium W5-51b TaxID=1130999 RepID=H9BX74_9BACT|nr:peptidase M15A [uncultured bacterium W5-51b]
MALEFDLDAPCGRYLTFRDLIECGETWHRASGAGKPIHNEPVQRASLDALLTLCEIVLDPVIDEFGAISLTYGLAGSQLSRRAATEVGGVAPKLDQHAAHELNRNNRRICERGGSAADFRVSGVSSLEVARWIVSSTRFDRLYYYGSERPLHVSTTKSDPLGQIVVLRTKAAGRRVPLVVDAEDFLEMSDVER